MRSETPRAIVEVKYHRAAQEYLYRLPPEHFMEATPQATQREITVESFALVRSVRPDVHYFNELLVQYPLPRRRRPGQIVPDNMVVLYDGPLVAVGSYDVPLQPVGPFLVLEYVSKGSERKDYDQSQQKYEQQLKVPYFLLFYPDIQELTLFRHTGEKFVSVKPNELGRRSIPELEMEVAILDGWARYWFRGELLPLPADMKRELDKMRTELKGTLRELKGTLRELKGAEEENTRLRAELERLRGK